MQEPTTTTAAAASATSSCHCLPESPDAAIAQSRQCPTWRLPFNLAPPVTRDAAHTFPNDAGLQDLGGSPTWMPEITPCLPTAPSFSRNCLPAQSLMVGHPTSSRLRAARHARGRRGGKTFRHSGDALPSARPGARPRTRTPPSSRAAEGAGRGGTSGTRTHPARGARAGWCVGRGRARVTCTT